MAVGDNHLGFDLVVGSPNLHNRINGRRSDNLKDHERFVRLAHHFNAINLIGNQVTSPMGLPANNRHLVTYRTNLTLPDLSFHCTVGYWNDAFGPMIGRGTGKVTVRFDPRDMSQIRVITDEGRTVSAR